MGAWLSSHPGEKVCAPKVSGISPDMYYNSFKTNGMRRDALQIYWSAVASIYKAHRQQIAAKTAKEDDTVVYRDLFSAPDYEEIEVDGVTLVLAKVGRERRQHDLDTGSRTLRNERDERVVETTKKKFGSKPYILVCFEEVNLAGIEPPTLRQYHAVARYTGSGFEDFIATGNLIHKVETHDRNDLNQYAWTVNVGGDKKVVKLAVQTYPEFAGIAEAPEIKLEATDEIYPKGPKWKVTMKENPALPESLMKKFMLKDPDAGSWPKIKSELTEGHGRIFVRQVIGDYEELRQLAAQPFELLTRVIVANTNKVPRRSKCLFLYPAVKRGVNNFKGYFESVTAMCKVASK